MRKKTTHFIGKSNCVIIWVILYKGYCLVFKNKILWLMYLKLIMPWNYNHLFIIVCAVCVWTYFMHLHAKYSVQYRQIFFKSKFEILISNNVTLLFYIHNCLALKLKFVNLIHSFYICQLNSYQTVYVNFKYTWDRLA